jgi:hypothetical protein
MIWYSEERIKIIESDYLKLGIVLNPLSKKQSRYKAALSYDLD